MDKFQLINPVSKESNIFFDQQETLKSLLKFTSHLKILFFKFIRLKLSCTKLLSQPIYLTLELFLLLKGTDKYLKLDWHPRIVDNIFQFAFVVGFLRKSALWHNFRHFVHLYFFESFILVYVRAQSL